MQDKQKPRNPSLILIGVGSIFTSMIIVGFLLGYWVDQYFQTTPVFMLLFGLLGMIGGMIRAYKMLSTLL